MLTVRYLVNSRYLSKGHGEPNSKHDMLVTDETESAHLVSLQTALAKAGLRAKKHKCQFMVLSVTYLGHEIDAQGLHPLPDKVQAISRHLRLET